MYSYKVCFIWNLLRGHNWLIHHQISPCEYWSVFLFFLILISAKVLHYLKTLTHLAFSKWEMFDVQALIYISCRKVVSSRTHRKRLNFLWRHLELPHISFRFCGKILKNWRHSNPNCCSIHSGILNTLLRILCQYAMALHSIVCENFNVLSEFYSCISLHIFSAFILSNWSFLSRYQLQICGIKTIFLCSVTSLLQVVSLILLYVLTQV